MSVNPSHTILIIDTAFESCQVGIWQGDICLVVRSEQGGGKHDIILAPMVEALLEKHRVKISDLTEIVVTTGPGRFTGLRVGIAFARGLALVHRTPLKGVMTTDAFRWQLGKVTEKSCAVIVAVKRGESFVQRCNPPAPIERVMDADFGTYFPKYIPILIGGVFSPEIKAKLGDHPHITPVPEAGDLSLEAVYAVSKAVPAEKNAVIRPYYAL